MAQLEYDRGKGEFTLTGLPAIGSILWFGKQPYTLFAWEPYTRLLDGAASFVLTWTTACPVCGEAFEVKTGLRKRGITRRCGKHRGLGRVRGKRQPCMLVRLEEPADAVSPDSLF